MRPRLLGVLAGALVVLATAPIASAAPQADPPPLKAVSIETIRVQSVPEVDGDVAAMFADSSPLAQARSTEQVEQERREEAGLTGWVTPLPRGRLTSPYGERGPVGDLAVNPFHNGVDLAAPIGEVIVAACEGTVLHVGYGDWGGHTGGVVVIEHTTPAGSFLTVYNHMATTGILVREGQGVQAGEPIAHVGNEGLSTGPHLHLSVYETAGSGAGARSPDGGTLDPEGFFAQRDVQLRGGGDRD